MASEQNLIAGPLDVWVAPTGEALPEINDLASGALGKAYVVPAGNWTQIGFTVDGEDFVVNYEPVTEGIAVNEAMADVQEIMIGEKGFLSFMMAEKDLAALDKAIGAAALSTVAAGASQVGQDILKIGGGTYPTLALLLVGTSPEGGYRVGHVFKAKQVEAVEFKSGKKHSGIPIKFKFLEDTTRTAGDKLMRWYDQTAAATS